MGSSYFYLEFLIALVHLLRTSSRSEQFRNPALFALEYTLSPDATFPKQLQQTLLGYEYLLSILPDPSRVCVAGDSAGATLLLSMLLHLGRQSPAEPHRARPGYAILVSPWTTLVSSQNQNTKSDYINADSLHRYALQYAGSKVSLDDPLVSPGMCKDQAWWRRAAPSRGLAFMFGSEEVLADETRELVERLQKAGVEVVVDEEEASIHAWPVASLFLSDAGPARLRGLQEMVKMIGDRLGEHQVP
ncbi:MAG: hypothetical protein M1823_005109 [Watsoniomyces obsoletus]|nr:MAG: hypothetical protein M1823_005109 [Watsoniomyces obsoletus]